MQRALVKRSFTCPPEMSIPNLARQSCESMSFDTLRGVFADFRVGNCARGELVEAIRCWQITAAKEAI
jgi:hypothetical protein